MSSFHEKCTSKQETKQETPPLKLKPFCDCIDCTSKDCPDIISRLGISLIEKKTVEKSCDFGLKVDKKGSAKRVLKKNVPQRSSLLDVISTERDCACEVMARAVRSNVHMNIGLSEQRNKPPPSPTEPTQSNDDNSSK